MDEFKNSILTFFLTENFDSFLSSIFLVVLSIPLYIIKDDKNKKRAIAIILDVLAAIIIIITFIVSQIYTIVPNIADSSRDSAIESLKIAELTYDLRDFQDDEGKTVYSFSPQSGVVVKKGTKVSVTLINKNNEMFFTRMLNEETYFSQNKIFDKISIETLTPFNTNSLELYFSDIGVYMHTDNEEYSRELGQENLDNALVQLINYENDTVVLEKYCDDTGYVKFTEIPNGSYIFKVICEGYETLISTNPFKLSYNSNQKEDVLCWGVNLTNPNDEFYKTQFKIKIVDEEANPIIGKEFEVRPIKHGNDSGSYTSISVYTDENGYISLWHSIEEGGTVTEYFDVVTFELNQSYTVSIFDKNGVSKSIDGSNNKEEYSLIF